MMGRAVIGLAVALAACGESSPGDDGGDDGSCAPDELFCAGDELRTCTSSGMDSVREWACPALPRAQQCVACSGDGPSGFSCDTDEPVIHGTGSFGSGAGAWDFDYRYPGGCDAPALQARAFADGGVFRHDALLGSYQWIDLGLRRLSSYSGPLFEPRDPSVANVTLSIQAPWADGAVCLNATAAPISPPSAGTVRVDLAGTAFGDAFTIEVHGYLWCVMGSTVRWYPVDLTVDGLVY